MKQESIKNNKDLFWSRQPKFSNRGKSGGQAMMTAVILFVFISLTVLFGIANPVLRQAGIVRDLERSRGSYFLAESGMEDAVYRLKNGIPYTSGQSLTLNGFDAVTEVLDISGGKVVTTTADWDNHIRKVQTELEIGVGAAFHYGVQAGTGGLELGSNAGIEGNVYANGNIVGDNGSYVTGSAFAANSTALSEDQDNIPDNNPPNSIIFRNSAGTEDLAQKFQVSTTELLNKIQFLIKKNGSPGSATVKIVADNSGNPGSTVLSSGTLSSSLITTSYGIVDVVFSPNIELTRGLDYWFVIDNSSNSASNYYTIGANSTYSLGLAKVGRYGSSWSNTTPTGLDSYFSVHLGGIYATIDNVDVGSNGVGDTWAHTVNNSTVAGNLYCKVGSGNNKSCNTSQADPSPQGFPISLGNINQWKSEAEAVSVYNGNYTIDDSSALIGPMKINGNLNIRNNADVTLTGALWVTGDIDLSNNVTVRLASSFGASGSVIIADGNISLSNNVDFSGSGTSGSYIMLLTTSDCPTSVSCSGTRAIEVDNNAGTVILNAQWGTIRFSNNSGAKEAVAYKIELESNASIIYETGLASVNFSTGPSGGWNVGSWKEVE